MATKDNQIIFSVEVKDADVIKALRSTQDEIAEYKKRLTDLHKAYTDGEKDEESYKKEAIALGEAIKLLGERQRGYAKDLRNQMKQDKVASDSLVAMRARLSNLTKAYDELSKAEIANVEIGGKKLKELNDLTAEISKAEQASGRFQRSVGNYPNLGRDISQILGQVNPQLGAMGNLLQNNTTITTTAKKAIEGLSSAFKISAKSAALLAGALGGVLAAAVVGVVTVYNKMEEANEKAKARLEEFNSALSSTNYGKQMLTLKELQDTYNALGDDLKAKEKFITDNKDRFTELGISVTSVTDAENVFKNNTDSFIKSLEARAKAAAALSLIEKEYAKQLELKEKIANETIRDSTALEKAQDMVESYVPDAMLTSVKALQYTGLITSKDAVMTNLVKEQTESEERLANFFAIITKETEEANKALEEAGVKLIDNTSGLIQQQQKKISDLQAEANREANKERLAELNKQIKKETELLSKLQGSGTTAITNQEAFNLSQLQLKHSQELQKELMDNEKLSYQERASAMTQFYALQTTQAELNRTQQLKQANLTNDKKKLIEETFSIDVENINKARAKALESMQKSQFAKSLEGYKTNLANRLALARKGSEAELNIKEDQLNQQRKVELENAEKTGADTLLINKKFDKQIRDLKNDLKVKAIQDKAKEALKDNELVKQSALERIEYEKANAQAEYDALNSLADQNNELAIARQTALTEHMNELARKETTVRMQQAEAQKQVMISLAGAYANVIGSMAEEGTAFAEFAKGLALFQIGLDTAQALTAGIKQAQSVPFPLNIGAIATTTLSILSAVAKAKKYLTSSSMPAYATGGLIEGSGSGTSDSIIARVSNGESIMTARATEMFQPILSTLNQMGGGVPIHAKESANQVNSETFLEKAMTKAFKNMKNPVVSVRAIDNVNERSTNEVKPYNI